MTDCQKVFLFGQHSRAKRKAGRPRLEWGNVVKKDLKEIRIPREGINRVALNRLGGRRSMRSYVGLRRLGTC